jgi:hypothetical protein
MGELTDLRFLRAGALVGLASVLLAAAQAVHPGLL